MSYLCVTSVLFFFVLFIILLKSLLICSRRCIWCVGMLCEWLDCSHHLKWSKKTGRKRKMVGVKCPAKRGGQIHQFIYLSTLHNTQESCSPLGENTLDKGGKKKKTPVGKMGWGDKCIVWGWKAGELFTCQKSQDNTGKCILRPDECKNIQWFLNDRLSRSLWKRNQSKADLGYLLIKFD